MVFVVTLENLNCKVLGYCFLAALEWTGAKINVAYDYLKGQSSLIKVFSFSIWRLADISSGPTHLGLFFFSEHEWRLRLEVLFSPHAISFDLLGITGSCLLSFQYLLYTLQHAKYSNVPSWWPLVKLWWSNPLTSHQFFQWDLLFKRILFHIFNLIPFYLDDEESRQVYLARI